LGFEPFSGGRLFGQPGKLYEWLQASCITVCHLTPSMGHLLMSGRALEKFGPLRTLKGAFFGVTSCGPASPGNFARCTPAAQIVNCYGTSETPQVMGYHVALASSIMGLMRGRPPAPVACGQRH